MKPRKSVFWLGIATLALSIPAWGADQPVDFTKEIQPILLKSCLECHGPEKQKGKLRLDTKADSFKSAETIVAGKAEDSELYKRISLPAGHEDIMPNKGEPLTKPQIELFKNWINQGASWPDGLVIKAPEDPNAEKDPRQPVQPSPAEKKAIEQLAQLGVQVRPVAMNVAWTQANFRGADSNNLDKAIALLKDILTLEDLNLAGLNIKNDQLKNLSGLVNLTHLHLEKTPVTDEGLAHLKPLVNLRYLNLYETQVTDAGLDSLKGLNHLRHLYLWQTKVTEEGAKKLQAALPKANINRGWELTALAQKIEEIKKVEEEKKKKEAEEKAKAEKEKKETEAKAKAEKEKKEAEEKAKAESAKKEEAKPEAKTEEKPKEEKKDN